MCISLIYLFYSRYRPIDQRRTYGLFRSVEAWWQHQPASIDSISWFRYWWYVGTAIAAYVLIISLIVGVALLWLVAITSPITWPLTHSIYLHRTYSKLFPAFCLATVGSPLLLWGIMRRQAVLAVSRKLRHLFA